MGSLLCACQNSSGRQLKTHRFIHPSKLPRQRPYKYAGRSDCSQCSRLSPSSRDTGEVIYWAARIGPIRPEKPPNELSYRCPQRSEGNYDFSTDSAVQGFEVNSDV